jgi:hypothetical protein
MMLFTYFIVMLHVVMLNAIMLRVTASSFQDLTRKQMRPDVTDIKCLVTDKVNAKDVF